MIGHKLIIEDDKMKYLFIGTIFNILVGSVAFAQRLISNLLRLRIYFEDNISRIGFWEGVRWTTLQRRCSIVAKTTFTSR